MSRLPSGFHCFSCGPRSAVQLRGLPYRATMQDVKVSRGL